MLQHGVDDVDSTFLKIRNPVVIFVIVYIHFDVFPDSCSFYGKEQPEHFSKHLVLYFKEKKENHTGL